MLENGEPTGEVLPDDPAKLQEMFKNDRGSLMRLAARLTSAAQALESTTANFDPLDEVIREIDNTKKRLGRIALKLGHISATLPHLIDRNIETAN